MARWTMLLSLCLLVACATGEPPGAQKEPDAAANCTPDCSVWTCGQIDPVCGTTCGDVCDPGCTAHCSNGSQDCDETGVDCGGHGCAACGCTPDCTGRSCGQIEPTCGTACGNACDAGCTAHCSDGTQDCGETGLNCGGGGCGSCSCTPSCAGLSCGQIEATCGTACGTVCDAGCSARCADGIQDCDETGVDCGGSVCSACTTTSCGMPCYGWAGSCSFAYFDACDGCDMGCGFDDPDCDDPASTCLAACPCLSGFSSWYCDGFDDCADPSCECAGE